jgi:hypothetical protein
MGHSSGYFFFGILSLRAPMSMRASDECRCDVFHRSDRGQKAIGCASFDHRSGWGAAKNQASDAAKGIQRNTGKRNTNLKLFFTFTATEVPFRSPNEGMVYQSDLN